MTALLMAMECEAQPILERLTAAQPLADAPFPAWQGRLGDRPVTVVVTGIGKVNAAAATAWTIDRLGVAGLVNLGVAGSLDVRFPVGGVYAVDRVVQCDFDISEAGDEVRCQLPGFAAVHLPLVIPAGFAALTCATSDFFTSSLEEVPFVRGELGAVLRDMELGAVAQVAARWHRPLAALKAVSDVHAGGRPPATEQYQLNLAAAMAQLSAALPGFLAALAAKGGW